MGLNVLIALREVWNFQISNIYALRITVLLQSFFSIEKYFSTGAISDE